MAWMAAASDCDVRASQKKKRRQPGVGIQPFLQSSLACPVRGGVKAQAMAQWTTKESDSERIGCAVADDNESRHCTEEGQVSDLGIPAGGGVGHGVPCDRSSLMLRTQWNNFLVSAEEYPGSPSPTPEIAIPRKERPWPLAPETFRGREHSVRTGMSTPSMCMPYQDERTVHPVALPIEMVDRSY
ncbi:hypothetical protein BJV78DRAFT_1350512 [Lactifluus subvellereus]|nr:hypothetical protein BJV78DRAFT_1350512 [Lactifluus subvellereus]